MKERLWRVAKGAVEPVLQHDLPVAVGSWLVSPDQVRSLTSAIDRSHWDDESFKSGRSTEEVKS